jgi:hypothetical protein
MPSTIEWGALAVILACCVPPVTAERLDVRPIAPPPQGAYGFLGFEIRAPWMDGHLQMRFPETLHTSLGLAFIDHDRADMRPISALEPWPEWRRNANTGAWSYAARTREGIEFGGTVTPQSDRVRMEFRVRNRTQRQVTVSNQMCLVMAHSKDFGERNALARMKAFVKEHAFDLTETRPSPGQKGRDPWILMLTQTGSKAYTGARDWPDGWWVVDPYCDVPVIMRESADGKHLLAVAWDGDPQFLMTNTRIPCLHAGPTNHFEVPAGKQCVWRGVIWLMPNDPAKLLSEYRRSRLK